MKFILYNKCFIGAILLIVSQQLFVGLSTYFIGRAGLSIMTDSSHSMYYVALFFTAIVAAYILGAAAIFFGVRAKNQSWLYYCEYVFGEIDGDISLSSQKNKQATFSWLSNEALTTIDEFISSCIDIAGTYLNAIFTFTAFFIILGFGISSVILFTMIISIALLFASKNKIRMLASEIQKSKLIAFDAISHIWDRQYFGTRELKQISKAEFHTKLGIYFGRLEIHKILSLCVSTLPILISIPVICYTSIVEIRENVAIIGGIISTMPRVLQVFQTLQYGTTGAGNLLFLMKKIENMMKFPKGLVGQDLKSNLSWPDVKVSLVNGGTDIGSSTMLIQAIDGSLQPGRYLIQGSNGAGKSTLLKKIKASRPDFIMLAPNINISGDNLNLSLGQIQAAQLKLLDSLQFTGLLLDEWDSNLDAKNYDIFSKRIDDWATTMPVIEVRH